MAMAEALWSIVQGGVGVGVGVGVGARAGGEV
jgi:hypothetical protein